MAGGRGLGKVCEGKDIVENQPSPYPHLHYVVVSTYLVFAEVGVVVRDEREVCEKIALGDHVRVAVIVRVDEDDDDAVRDERIVIVDNTGVSNDKAAPKVRAIINRIIVGLFGLFDQTYLNRKVQSTVDCLPVAKSLMSQL